MRFNIVCLYAFGTLGFCHQRNPDATRPSADRGQVGRLPQRCVALRPS
jgi:hypothetical protein